MSLNDFDDTQFEDFSSEETPTEGSPEPSSGGGNGGNRNFMLAVGIIGAIFVISLIALGLYIFLGQPNQASALRETAAVINANNTATAMSATDSARLNIESLTKTAGAPTKTPIPTNTPVIAIPTATANLTATSLAGALSDPAARTATVAAFQTQVAQGTQTTGTSTALPQTGFADDIGLPGLLGAAAILLLVIFLARRLRLSQS